MPKTHLNNLACELAVCDNECEGVINDPSRGIIPRCLYFEPKEGTSKGAIVVGMNPGSACTKERAELIGDPSFEKVYQFWEKNRANKHQYYLRTRRFLQAASLSGSILWTELVKCESFKKQTLPLQTYRTCVDKYLYKEVALCPDDWPIVALGKDAFNACALLFREKKVIGIAHPTGSHGGSFHNLFTDPIKPALAPHFEAQLNACGNNDAVWLIAKKSGGS